MITQLSKGTVKIGDTLFINGTPHVQCGRCEIIVKQFDGEITVRGGKDKVTRELKPYRITMLLGWLEGQDEIIMIDGFPTIKRNIRPMIKSVPGCKACWQVQQERKLRFSKLADWAFKRGE